MDREYDKFVDDGSGNTAVRTFSSNGSTAAKQDTMIALITALNALVTTIKTSQLTDDKTHIVLQQIRDAIALPPDYNEATNARNVGGAVTVSSGTVTSVTTLVGQTNIGGFTADMITENNSFQDWSASVRSKLGVTYNGNY